MRLIHTILLAIAIIAVSGCSAKPAKPPAPAAAPQAAEPSALHSHGSGVSKLGLGPAVVDNLMEVPDAAVIQDGKLVSVDVANTLDGLHGSIYVVGESTVLVTIDGKIVAWSDTKTDYPVQGHLPGPVVRENNRWRMSPEQLTKLFELYFPKGQIAVKDGKLHLTTGR